VKKILSAVVVVVVGLVALGGVAQALVLDNEVSTGETNYLCVPPPCVNVTNSAATAAAVIVARDTGQLRHEIIIENVSATQTCKLIRASSMSTNTAVVPQGRTLNPGDIIIEKGPPWYSGAYSIRCLNTNEAASVKITDRYR